MTDSIRILLADDHALFRHGLMEILKEQSEFVLLGAASDGKQAIEHARKHKPDIILLDVHMPTVGGVEALRTIKDELNAKVLMLTVSDKDEDLLAAIEAGADGYLLKNAEPEELFRAIKNVASGQGALSPEVTGTVMKQAIPKQKDPSVDLTPREREVLDLVAKGQTTAEIALHLKIASSTVKTHVRNIMTKLEAANRTEAVAKALELNLLGNN